MGKCRSMVVKLGGSAITDKRVKHAVKEESLKRLAGILADYWKGGGRLAIVHGGGSFGHFEVQEILKTKDVLDPQDAPRIQLSMLELSLIVARELIAKGIPVVVHPPHTMCRSGSLGSCNLEPVLASYNLDLVPLVYGDAIPTEDGVRIISGDDLAAAIASLLRAKCLVYVIEEPGILDKSGSVIPVLSSIEQLEEREEEGRVDVTGGIRKKLMSALEASKEEITVVVTNTDGLERIVKGEEPGSVGTLVKSRH